MGWFNVLTTEVVARMEFVVWIFRHVVIFVARFG